MKRSFRWFCCLAALAVPMLAQNIDYSNALTVIPWPRVNVFPGTCREGQMLERVDMASGRNIFQCASDGLTWNPVSGSGSGTGLGDPGVGGILKRTTFNVTAIASPADFFAAMGFTPMNPINNLSELTNPAAARTALGLGSAATHPITDFQTALGYVPMNPQQNLADVGSVPAARTSLGLGTAATQDYGGLHIIAVTTSPAFTASPGQLQTLTLTADTTSSTISGTIAMPVYFLICQDVTGAHQFTWPAGTTGGMVIGQMPSRCNGQQMFFDGANLHAMGLGAINQ